jgi:preprotein translocase subunit Sec63
MQAINEAFGEGKSLYEVLGVAPSASAAEIKKGYFKLALTCVSASSSDCARCARREPADSLT